jgi:hypothetical protein
MQCPACGIVQDLARVYLVDDNDAFEESVLIVNAEAEIRNNSYLIVQDVIGWHYYVIKNIHIADTFAFCLNCETVFS